VRKIYLVAEWNDKIGHFEGILEKLAFYFSTYAIDHSNVMRQKKFVPNVVHNALLYCNKHIKDMILTPGEKMNWRTFIYEVMYFIFGSRDSCFNFDEFVKIFRENESTSWFSLEAKSASHQYLLRYVKEHKTFVPFICIDLRHQTDEYINRTDIYWK